MVLPLFALLLAAQPKVAVLPVSAGEGIPPTTAAALTEALSGEVRRRAGAEVVSQREISAVLSLERQKAMLGCTTDACMAELGGALGCDRLVTGDLARLGESFLLHLRLVETGRARVVAQADRRLRGGTIDDVLDALPPMVQELFAAAGPAPTAAAAPVPNPAPAAPPAPPAIQIPKAKLLPDFAEEPIEVPPADRQKLSAWADDEGHLLAANPYGGLDSPLYFGDAKKLHLVRVRGGRQDGTEAASRTFWDPRALRGAESMLEWRGEKATLSCGTREIPLRAIPPREAARQLHGATFLAPRWRRVPHALARDDGGAYFYVDGARGADGAPVPAKPDHRLWLGRKGQLAPVELSDVISDGGALIVITGAGRLEVKRGGRDGVTAAWITAGGRKALTWLEPSDNGRLIYGELGVYGGERLGTPCDGRF